MTRNRPSQQMWRSVGMAAAGLVLGLAVSAPAVASADANLDQPHSARVISQVSSFGIDATATRAVPASPGTLIALPQNKPTPSPTSAPAKKERSGFNKLLTKIAIALVLALLAFAWAAFKKSRKKRKEARTEATQAPQQHVATHPQGTWGPNQGHPQGVMPGYPTGQQPYPPAPQAQGGGTWGQPWSHEEAAPSQQSVQAPYGQPYGVGYDDGTRMTPRPGSTERAPHHAYGTGGHDVGPYTGQQIPVQHSASHAGLDNPDFSYGGSPDQQHGRQPEEQPQRPGGRHSTGFAPAYGQRNSYEQTTAYDPGAAAPYQSSPDSYRSADATTDRSAPSGYDQHSGGYSQDSAGYPHYAQSPYDPSQASYEHAGESWQQPPAAPGSPYDTREPHQAYAPPSNQGSVYPADPLGGYQQQGAPAAAEYPQNAGDYSTQQSPSYSNWSSSSYSTGTEPLHGDAPSGSLYSGSATTAEPGLYPTTAASTTPVWGDNWAQPSASTPAGGQPVTPAPPATRRQRRWDENSEAQPRVIQLPQDHTTTVDR